MVTGASRQADKSKGPAERRQRPGWEGTWLLCKRSGSVSIYTHRHGLGGALSKSWEENSYVQFACQHHLFQTSYLWVAEIALQTNFPNLIIYHSSLAICDWTAVISQDQVAGNSSTSFPQIIGSYLPKKLHHWDVCLGGRGGVPGRSGAKLGVVQLPRNHSWDKGGVMMGQNFCPYPLLLLPLLSSPCTPHILII